ncbi:MAG: undecaprenyl-diphosphate phosphatase [Alphaproteobacteria bacterium]|nr:undecaprenyl-diphosphate phosphatase [Alphaproteobacteria bacterium]MBV8549289.1 undecaprenyl-diphosphate phosphatase [Alphaproteobacteria bacterium]
MTFLQALWVAILQGVTELFPISSLGHAVIMPRLLGWSLDQKAPDFLPFLVVLHLGTAAALLLYFWRDWLGFARAVLGVGAVEDVTRERRIFTRICLATLPAVVLGFALEHKLRSIFGTPELAAVFLFINGFVLFAGEKLQRRLHTKKNLAVTTPLEAISLRAVVIIGACQALALIPGISRAGATMVGGLLVGLSHRDAARFSFLLATPIIAGAGVLEVPKLLHLLHDGASVSLNGGAMAMAGVVAGITAWCSTAFLMRYFKASEVEALNPFAYYCWAAGLVSLALMTL